MTLEQIVDAHPELFYPQTWWRGHTFSRAAAIGPQHPFGSTVRPDFTVWSEPGHVMVSARNLVALYVESPSDFRWQNFLWTDDYDDYGNRIYVAGIGQFGCPGFQIHRLLEPDGRWRYVR